MVAANDDRPRACGSNLADARLHRLVTLLDADRRRVHVADIRDVHPIERGDLLKVAVAANQRRLAANLTWAQPRAGPVRRSTVVRYANDRNVEAPRIFDVWEAHEGRRLREPRRRERCSRLVRHRRDSNPEAPIPNPTL